MANDYTVRYQAKIYQIQRSEVRPGLRGANVRLEARLDGSIKVRYQDRYISVSECQPPPKRPSQAPASPARRSKPPQPSESSRRAMADLLKGASVPLWRAAEIDRTRTQDTLD